MFKPVDQKGFSLIELILVMAITAGLAMIAFAGQRSLRSQAQFDAAIDKVVSSVADAYSQAVAGVNIVGTGDGTMGCTGAGVTPHIFAGTAWTADNAVPGGPIQVTYYKAAPGVSACAFDSRVVSLPATIQVNVSSPPSGQGGRMLFVRNDRGGMAVCPVTNLTTNVLPSFAVGGCTTGTLVLTFQDGDGHTSRVTIDQSGLARRDN